MLGIAKRGCVALRGIRIAHLACSSSPPLEVTLVANLSATSFGVVRCLSLHLFSGLAGAPEFFVGAWHVRLCVCVLVVISSHCLKRLESFAALARRAMHIRILVDWGLRFGLFWAAGYSVLKRIAKLWLPRPHGASAMLHATLSHGRLLGDSACDCNRVVGVATLVRHFVLDATRADSKAAFVLPSVALFLLRSFVLCCVRSSEA